MTLQRQYIEEVRVIPVPMLFVPRPQPAQARPAPQTQAPPLPAVVTIASALVFAFSDNEVVKALALQGVSIGGAAWVQQSLN